MWVVVGAGLAVDPANFLPAARTMPPTFDTSPAAVSIRDTCVCAGESGVRGARYTVKAQRVTCQATFHVTKTNRQNRIKRSYQEARKKTKRKERKERRRTRRRRKKNKKNTIKTNEKNN